MDLAASFPAYTAFTTVWGPVTTSPPENTPGILVAKVTGSTSILFHLLTETPLPSVRKDKSASWPMAGITASHGTMNSEPLISMGRRRPLASGSPSSIRVHSIPVTLPFSPMTRFGATRNSIRTPSSNASSISSGDAGISARDLRYRMKTSFDPVLIAVRTASIATLPPPITATLSPRYTFSPKFIRWRKSTPWITPCRSSPGTFSLLLRIVPQPTNTAL